jgi:predicted DsbA family dithiol-disulfide isomerase
MKIEIWSDVVCPWCAIGKKRLDDALADFPHAAEVEVVIRSFELDPTAPVGGSEPMVDVLGRKYGVGAAEAATMMGRVEGIAADEGLVMHMATTIHSNTRDAHRLLHLALATGGRDLQARLNADLMAAHFRHGADVADQDVLRSVARGAGLDADAVDEVLAGDAYAEAFDADVRRARAYGATGVPFFVVDEKYGVSGAQPRELFTQVLEQAWAEAHPLQMAGVVDAEVCGTDGCPI